jgi:clan AA aspartic protease (TIGR02281 family)
MRASNASRNAWTRVAARPSLVASSSLASKIRRMAAHSKPVSAAPLTSLGNPYHRVRVGPRQSPNKVVSTHSDKRNLKAMRRFAPLALAAVLLGGGSAHASYLCNAPTQYVGKIGANPVVSTEFGVTDTNGWWVNHRLADGTIIRRSEQYSMNPFAKDGHQGWQGRLNKNQDLWMFGEVSMRNDGWSDVWYTETLYDHVHGDKVVMRSAAACIHEGPPPVPVVAQGSGAVTSSPSAVVASAPQSTPAATGSSMPLMFKGAAAYASISLGTLPVIALVDTGATSMTVPQKTADWLLSNGQATTAPSKTMYLADGSAQELAHIAIASVTIAGHELRNVEAAVTPDGADILLGLGVLNQVSTKFAIDTANSRLMFN